MGLFPNRRNGSIDPVFEIEKAAEGRAPLLVGEGSTNREIDQWL